jgi:5-methylcytosine-specific restriction endonuclease McrA
LTLKLSINLVPSTSWFDNVRSAVSRSQWDLIRKRVYSEAYNICQICGGIGPNHPVECHEIWDYEDSKKLQILEGMIALCPSCHLVKHMGLAGIRGEREKTFKHFVKINKLKRREAEIEIENAFKLWAARSRHKWTVDISHLKTYGIDIKKLSLPKNDFNYRNTK